MSVASVRAAMGTALRTISGLHVSDYIVDEVVAPHAMFDFAVEPHLVFARGADVYRFRIKVFASMSAEVAGQKYLDLLRDPSTTTNLAYVLEENATLAAAVDYCRVTGISEVQVATIGAVDYLMCEWEAEVVL